MLRQCLNSTRTTLASRLALAAAVASLVVLSAGTGTAIARSRGGGGIAIARSHGGNTTAVSVNTTDHNLVFNLSFAILKVTGDVVDNQNIAAAYASCDACQTVAISIQTLLVESPASTVAPINEASSRNQNCVQCDTLAIAYQFVVAAGTKLEFTPEGRREVAYIRRQLETLRREVRRPGMTGAQIVAAVDALMKQYASVLSTQLVPASQPGARAGRANDSGATLHAAANSSSGTKRGVQTGTATSSAPNQGVSTTTSAAGSPTSSSTPTDTSGAAAGTTGTTPTSAPTDSGTTSTNAMTATGTTTAPTTGTTPTTTGTTTPTTTGTTTPTTTGTTSTSDGLTTTNTSSGATTTPSGTTTTPSGATTSPSGTTTNSSTSTAPTTP